MYKEMTCNLTTITPDIKMFFNYRRVRNINRCNNFNRNKNEDVAQHSFFTSLLAMIITKEFFRNYPHMENQVSMSVVLEKALTHDLEEAITSDIPSNVKHISPEFNDVIQEVICRMMTECYEDTSDTFHDILEISINSKKGIEGSIVSLADILELSIYCCEEVCAGNFFMKGLLIKCIRLVENSNFYKLYNLPFVNNLVESIKMLSAKNGCSIAAIQELYHL